MKSIGEELIKTAYNKNKILPIPHI